MNPHETIRVAPIGRVTPREPFGLPTLAPFGKAHNPLEYHEPGTHRLRKLGREITVATWNRATALLLRGNLTDTELECYKVECATLKIAGLDSPSEVGRGNRIFYADLGRVSPSATGAGK